MNTKLVTKDSLREMLSNPNRAYVEAVIGRALVALFDRQTRDEKVANGTNHNNNIGFTGADARGGSLTAKTYLKRKSLEDWQIAKWTKVAKNGYPRLCKYAGQLNAIAIEKTTVR